MRIVLVLVLLPQVAAWGPYAHQYWCGLSDEIIYSEFGNATDSFKVGCWAPDVFKHFNSSFYMHSWHFADFLANFARDRAESNRETAFAFGFGAHLLADQLGHRKGGPLSEEQETVGAPDPGHLMYDRYLNTNKEGKLVWRPFYFFTDDLHPILIDSTTAYAREYPEKLISPKTLETEGRPLNATSTADAISNGVARWNTFRRHVIADVAWKKQLYGNPCDVGSEEEFNKNFDRLKEWTQNVQGWWLETLIAAEPAKTAQWSSQTQINHLYRDHGGVTAWEVASLSSGLLFITTLFVFLMYQDHVRHLSRMSRKNLKMIK